MRRTFFVAVLILYAAVGRAEDPADTPIHGKTGGGEFIPDSSGKAVPKGSKRFRAPKPNTLPTAVERENQLGHLRGKLACTPHGDVLGLFDRLGGDGNEKSAVINLSPRFDSPLELRQESYKAEVAGTRAALSEDGRWLVSMKGVPPVIAIEDLKSGKPIRNIPLEPGIGTARVSATGEFLALQRNWKKEPSGEIHNQMEVLIHDVSTGERTAVLKNYSEVAWISRDGSMVLAKSLDDNKFAVVDVKTGNKIISDVMPTPPAESADGKLLAVAVAGGARLYHMPEKRVVTALKTDATTAHGLALSRDGNFLAVSEPRLHKIYEAETGKEVTSIPTGERFNAQPGVFCGDSRYYVASTIARPQFVGVPRRTAQAGRSSEFPPGPTNLYDLMRAPGLTAEGMGDRPVERLGQEARGAQPAAAWRAIFELRRRGLSDEALKKAFDERGAAVLDRNEHAALAMELDRMNGVPSIPRLTEPQRNHARVWGAFEVSKLLKKMTAEEIQTLALTPLREALRDAPDNVKPIITPVLQEAENRVEANPDVLARRRQWLIPPPQAALP